MSLVQTEQRGPRCTRGDVSRAAAPDEPVRNAQRGPTLRPAECRRAARRHPDPLGEEGHGAELPRHAQLVFIYSNTTLSFTSLVLV